VVIKSNGLGISPGKENSTGLGTKISGERIAFPESNWNVHIENHSDGIRHVTTVTIPVPLRIKKLEND